MIALKVGARWLEKVPEVKKEVRRFFQEQFSASTDFVRPTLDGLNFTMLSDAEIRCWSLLSHLKI